MTAAVAGLVLFSSCESVCPHGKLQHWRHLLYWDTRQTQSGSSCRAGPSNTSWWKSCFGRCLSLWTNFVNCVRCYYKTQQVCGWHQNEGIVWRQLLFDWKCRVLLMKYYINIWMGTVAHSAGTSAEYDSHLPVCTQGHILPLKCAYFKNKKQKRVKWRR